MKKRRAHDREEHMDETWLIPYADLLTLLLALFILLFASTQIDQKKFEQLSRSLNIAFHGGSSFFQPSNVVPMNESGERRNNADYETPGETKAEIQEKQMTRDELAKQFEQETQDLKELKEKIDTYIDDNSLKTQLETVLNGEQLRIRISDNALFASGSANVRPEARQLAAAISNLLQEAKAYQIVVSGHTDDRPINTPEFPSNWDLSAKRALNFMKYLLNNENLSPAQFSAVGYGEYRPVANNADADGRAKNRRVEVSIMRNVQQQEK